MRAAGIRRGGCPAAGERSGFVIYRAQRRDNVRVWRRASSVAAQGQSGEFYPRPRLRHARLDTLIKCLQPTDARSRHTSRSGPKAAATARSALGTPNSRGATKVMHGRRSHGQRGRPDCAGPASYRKMVADAVGTAASLVALLAAGYGLLRFARRLWRHGPGLDETRPPY